MSLRLTKLGPPACKTLYSEYPNNTHTQCSIPLMPHPLMGTFPNWMATTETSPTFPVLKSLPLNSLYTLLLHWIGCLSLTSSVLPSCTLHRVILIHSHHTSKPSQSTLFHPFNYTLKSTALAVTLMPNFSHILPLISSSLLDTPHAPVVVLFLFTVCIHDSVCIHKGLG